MTRTEIEQMPAGREMDALIAERVMGLPIYDTAWPCGINYETGLLEASLSKPSEFPNLYPETHPVTSDDDWVEPVYYYSTDIAAAWQVVEGKGWFLYEGGLNGEIEWAVFAGARDIEDWTPLAVGETAPLAICRAALSMLANS